MRFKASISFARFPSFWAHILMAERVGKSAVLIFSAQTVRMMIRNEADTMMQYSSLVTDAVFSSFRCESRTNNIIALEILVENAIAGLVAGTGGDSVTLKLTKRDAAEYLRVETVPRDGGVSLAQDLPVRVISSAEMVRYAPPQLPPPAASLFLPAPRVLSAVVDRLKILGKVIRIDASSPPDASAELVVGVDMDLVSTRTYFRGLAGDTDAANTAGGVAKCSIAARDFSRTLHGVVALAATHAVQTRLAVVADAALYVSILLEDGSGDISMIHSIMSVDD
jgi:hypothetical protein